MKRLFGLKKRKIKVGGDEDQEPDDAASHNISSYAPPSVGTSSSAYDFQQVSDFPNVGIDNESTSSNVIPPTMSAMPTPSQSSGLAPMVDHDDNSLGAGYRYALTAYNDTISPVLSNEDGMGGGGGTLRSRLRRSAGSRHQSLIPSFQPLDSSQYDNYSTSDAGSRNTPLHDNLASTRNNSQRERDWAPIPEEPRTTSSPNNNKNNEEGGKSSSERVVTFDSSIEEYGSNTAAGPTLSSEQQIIPPSSTRSTHTSPQSATTPTSINRSPRKSSNNDQEHSMMIILQPGAIYEEKYGDAYVDQLPKYLYPSGYQSMRPRSGPWKLSIFIFCLFLWLSVFIVGHCYDRGKQYGIIDDDDANNNNNGDDGNNNGDNNNNNAVDDAFLDEVDDDAVVMETRWCGSKLLHFMWMISVTITVLAMSYCSIIGYVKVRDVAVAAGRSQPAGTFDGGENGDGGWRSDYYSKLDNVSSGGNDEESGSNQNNNEQYSSYQAGGDESRRYAPSIYQSDGMPQFLGGHIYRPTQAAITMTNRP